MSAESHNTVDEEIESQTPRVFLLPQARRAEARHEIHHEALGAGAQATVAG